MAVYEHPIWEKSLIPPRTLAKINRLNSEGRRLYVSTLLYNNAHRLNNLEAVAIKMGEDWLNGQVRFLNKVRREIEAIQELELSGDTSFEGHIDNDITKDKPS